MINKEAQLNTNIFDKPELEAIRTGWYANTWSMSESERDGAVKDARASFTGRGIFQQKNICDLGTESLLILC